MPLISISKSPAKSGSQLTHTSSPLGLDDGDEDGEEEGDGEEDGDEDGEEDGDELNNGGAISASNAQNHATIAERNS